MLCWEKKAPHTNTKTPSQLCSEVRENGGLWLFCCLGECSAYNCWGNNEFIILSRNFTGMCQGTPSTPESRPVHISLPTLTFNDEWLNYEVNKAMEWIDLIVDVINSARLSNFMTWIKIRPQSISNSCRNPRNLGSFLQLYVLHKGNYDHKAKVQEKHFTACFISMRSSIKAVFFFSLTDWSWKVHNIKCKQ